jgi:hypothetical protein
MHANWLDWKTSPSPQIKNDVVKSSNPNKNPFGLPRCGRGARLDFHPAFVPCDPFKAHSNHRPQNPTGSN